MKILSSIWIVMLAVVLGTGCQKKEAGLTDVAANPSDTSTPSAAQAKLPVLRLFIGAKELQTEVARTSLQLQTGMMFRKSIAENEAMLFVFPMPHQAAFWMRNTTVPLSCAYIDSDGVILEIHDLKPLDETSVQAHTDQVRFVLETAQGWFARNNVTTGMVVSAQSASLTDLFFRGR
jgi:uncharacterized membrane protein (UPF0127 family)